jgi:hypothetical protein
MPMITDKKVRSRILFIIFLWFASACSLNQADQGIYIFSYSFDFKESDHGWKAGFADYPAGPDSTALELKYEYTTVQSGDHAFMLSGNSHGEELFMFLKKKLTGLQPETNYTLTFSVELTSNNLQGTKDSIIVPGDMVFLKVGATAIEPKRILDRNKFVMNIDKGILGDSGQDMVYIGNLTPNPDPVNYINRSNSSSTTSPLVVRTDGDGNLWLIVGTDSGIEGVTTLYYSKINIALSTSK